MSGVLVVHCHPVAESFVGAVRNRAVDALQQRGHDVRSTDLHADGYAAARHASDGPWGRTLDDLRWCDQLVLVYPTWWGGQPALLKEWIDHVCGSARSGAGRFSKVRRITVVTTHGSSKRINMLEGEGGKRTITRNLAPTCGPRTRTTWLAMYGVDTSSSGDRQRFVDRVEQRLRRLN